MIYRLVSTGIEKGMTYSLTHLIKYLLAHLLNSPCHPNLLPPSQTAHSRHNLNHTLKPVRRTVRRWRGSRRWRLSRSRSYPNPPIHSLPKVTPYPPFSLLKRTSYPTTPLTHCVTPSLVFYDLILLLSQEQITSAIVVPTKTIVVNPMAMIKPIYWFCLKATRQAWGLFKSRWERR